MEMLEDKIEQETKTEKKKCKVASFVATAGLPLSQITFFGLSMYGLFELNDSHPNIAVMFLPGYCIGTVAGMVAVREGYVRMVKKIANYCGLTVQDK